jgi:hypothetical protein
MSDCGDIYRVSFSIPTSSVGLLIGKGGVTYKSFVEDSGAELNFQNSRDMPPSATERGISIGGTMSQIVKAVELILVKLQVYVPSSTLSFHAGEVTSQENDNIDNNIDGSDDNGNNDNDNSSSAMKSKQEPSLLVHWAIPKSSAGILIGRQGLRIKYINKMSGAWVKIAHIEESSTEDNERRVYIRGTKKQVEIALKIVKDLAGGRPLGGDVDNEDERERTEILIPRRATSAVLFNVSGDDLYLPSNNKLDQPVFAVDSGCCSTSDGTVNNNNNNNNSNNSNDSNNNNDNDNDNDNNTNTNSTEKIVTKETPRTPRKIPALEKVLQQRGVNVRIEVEQAIQMGLSQTLVYIYGNDDDREKASNALASAVHEWRVLFKSPVITPRSPRDRSDSTGVPSIDANNITEDLLAVEMCMTLLLHNDTVNLFQEDTSVPGSSPRKCELFNSLEARGSVVHIQQPRLVSKSNNQLVRNVCVTASVRTLLSCVKKLLFDSKQFFTDNGSVQVSNLEMVSDAPSPLSNTSSSAFPFLVFSEPKKETKIDERKSNSNSHSNDDCKCRNCNCGNNRNNNSSSDTRKVVCDAHSSNARNSNQYEQRANTHTHLRNNSNIIKSDHRVVYGGYNGNGNGNPNAEHLIRSNMQPYYDSSPGGPGGPGGPGINISDGRFDKHYPNGNGNGNGNISYVSTDYQNNGDSHHSRQHHVNSDNNYKQGGSVHANGVDNSHGNFKQQQQINNHLQQKNYHHQLNGSHKQYQYSNDYNNHHGNGSINGNGNGNVAYTHSQPGTHGIIHTNAYPQPNRSGNDGYGAVGANTDSAVYSSNYNIVGGNISGGACDSTIPPKNTIEQQQQHVFASTRTHGDVYTPENPQLHFQQIMYLQQQQQQQQQALYPQQFYVEQNQRRK